MFTFLIVILMILALLLTVAVLLQPGKGGGLDGTSFGGIGGQFASQFGARQTADFLQKFTIGAAIAILVLTILTNMYFLENTDATRAPVTVGAERPSTPTLPGAPGGNALPAPTPAAETPALEPTPDPPSESDGN